MVQLDENIAVEELRVLLSARRSGMEEGLGGCAALSAFRAELELRNVRVIYLYEVKWECSGVGEAVMGGTGGTGKAERERGRAAGEGGLEDAWWRQGCEVACPWLRQMGRRGEMRWCLLLVMRYGLGKKEGGLGMGGR